jgi:transcriptional regulator with XRE-family HTH domain
MTLDMKATGPYLVRRMTNGILRELRRARGLSMEDVARLSGVSWRTIQRIETGKSRPHRPTRDAIARALGVPRTEIWPEDDLGEAS